MLTYDYLLVVLSGITDVFRGGHRNIGAEDLINAGFLCWELLLFDDSLLLLCDTAYHSEGSGFFQNVVVSLPHDVALDLRRMESLATPLRNIKTPIVST
jgi:hypothetical protein